MNREDFKDNVAIAMVPMFTQMMIVVEKPTGLAVSGAQDTMGKAVLPDPKEVAARALGYAEICAQMRDAHVTALKALKKQQASPPSAKPDGTPQMELVRAKGNGNADG
jgi:hypothetical protein